jgi:predicted outer membrane protein
MKINQLAIAMLTILSVGSSLVAQTSTATQPANATNRLKSGASTLSKDQAFAKCLVIANQEQVAMSRFAKEKATNEEVKEFAATLEKEHQDCVKQLKELSPQSEGNTNAATGTNADSNSTSVDFVQLQQEISAQCMKDGQEYLSKKKGTKFDECFVGMQIAKHAGMHSTLTVLQRHATGKLQAVIKDGLEMNSKHMEAAVALMDRLAANDTAKLSKVSK